MKVLVGFLFLAFAVGGSSRGRGMRGRPVLLLACCAVITVSFLSLRAIS